MSYPFNEMKYTVCYGAVSFYGARSDFLGWKREEFDSAEDAQARVQQLQTDQQESISVMAPADATEWNAISFTRQPPSRSGSPE